MALNPDACGVIDPSIPQWKRELILRRRALGRTLQVGSSSVKLTCPAVVAVVRHPESSSGCENNTTNSQKCSPSVEDLPFSSLNQNLADFHPGTSSTGSVSNMRLLDSCSEVDNLVINNGIDAKNKQSGVVTNNSDTSVYSLIMGEDKSLNLKKKSASRPKLEKNNCSVTAKQRFFIEKVSSEGTNGKSSKDEDFLSDSSEELQYGPGIVNKLKTKYLSMTLREQKRHVRPSLSNLRRATSLENMLEGDDNLNEQTKTVTEIKNQAENVSLIDRSTQLKKTVGLNSNRGARMLGNHRHETMKRAQSMDTLLKSEARATLKPIVNENIIIVEKENRETNHPADSTTPLRRDVNTELPPPDLVKQTLKIFETSPKRKIRPTSQGNLAKLVAGFSNPPSQPSTPSLGSRSIDRRKLNQNNKPILSPKPTLSPDKLRCTKMGSPKRIQPLSSSVHTNKKFPSSSNASKPTGISNERGKPKIILSDQSIPDRKTVTSPNVLSPRSVSPIVTVLTNDLSAAPQSSDKVVHSINSVANGEKEVPSVHSDESEEIDGGIESSKTVPETALENIRRGGVSMQFSFNSESSQGLTTKSYLPRSKSPPQALNTSLLNEKIEKSPLPTSFVTPRQQSSPQPKQVGIIRPLVSTKQSSVTSTPALTEQEIEKNLINRVKSIEQPISKVVVAIKALPDNVVLGSVSADVVTNKSLSLSQGCASSNVKNQGLWDEKIWHSNQNTIVFNFSNRKEVPDYIENDGLILRGKRDRPRPGDGGFILLDGGTADTDESSTEAEAEDLLTSSPPSPCDVTFVGDNVVINGKSNLKRAPKQVKLRIQFNDEATTMFEYPSEASLVEEEVTDTVTVAGAGGRGRDETDVAQASQPSACASGAPGLSMNLGSLPPNFSPPPAPNRPPPPPPAVKAKAPRPPIHSLAPVGPPVPPRSPPRLFKSNSFNVVSTSSRKTVTQPNMSCSAVGKGKYFSMKKVRKPKPTIESKLNFDAKSDSVQSVRTESVKLTDDVGSVNVVENQSSNPVEEAYQQPKVVVASADSPAPIKENISDTESTSFIEPCVNYNSPTGNIIVSEIKAGGKDKYFSMKKVRKPKPTVKSESTFDAKSDSVPSIRTESVELTDTDESVKIVENQLSNPVEEVYQQPKVEVASVDSPAQIEKVVENQLSNPVEEAYQQPKVEVSSVDTPAQIEEVVENQSSNPVEEAYQQPKVEVASVDSSAQIEEVVENQLSNPVEEAYQQPKVEVASVDSSAQIEEVVENQLSNPVEEPHHQSKVEVASVDSSAQIEEVVENQLSNPVEEPHHQSKVEVAFVDNPSQIEGNISDTKLISFTDPDVNYNSLPDIKVSETKSSQSQSGNFSLNQNDIGKLDNCNVNVLNNNKVSGDPCQYGRNSQISQNRNHQFIGKESDNIACTLSATQRNLSNSSDENANEKTVISKNISELNHTKLSLGAKNTKYLTTRPVLDLKKQSKPVKIVQPLMGTKSLPSTLLSNLDSTPLYRPVYSKPSLVCSNSDLAVDPVLSRVLTQKKVPSPTFVNRSLSTSQVLVLDDWPLGTESLV